MAGEDGLMERLASHNRFFNDVISLIPPKYYLAEADEEHQQRIAARYMKNTKNKAPKQEIKERSKKAKRAKELGKTVIDIQQEQLKSEDAAAEDAQQQQHKASKHGKGGKKRGAASTQDGKQNDQRRKKPFLVSQSSNVSPHELRARLAVKLQEMKETRKAAEERVQRTKTTNKRSKLKEERQKKAMVRATRPQFTGTDARKGDAKDSTHDDTAAPLAFSKFEFANDNRKKKAKPNPKQLLQMAEREKQEIEALKASDAAKAAEVVEKKGWDKALKRAEGEKVFDNPKLMKKAIKTRERKKAKSKKTWEARVAAVEKEQKERQEKRERNLQARKDAKKQRKLKKMQKKRPGFEGK
ncbi:hypothetical protein PTSG_07591 [Salpingoeca rosetta]|uniref:Ribosomal RNA-processing protein 14/surfeit locus protein 6 C-terminal domain-containing protein n=1 Tax=Salpingoeca rosetta (strain ATCC 50818 / BSB-021) TaxID=946362 RepID=F2UH76_SALR5|nr:uncharacterized protein PTSG_07591 [Salpingoeca rosetta]EGD76475.1 hypothetical protein PTSG_07591 [Salpingoeca rosetta]|eukprot:XP_004991389.1 hypothetical protein PTSG_07591 [Salpingoeca rosetta]